MENSHPHYLWEYFHTNNEKLFNELNSFLETALKKDIPTPLLMKYVESAGNTIAVMREIELWKDKPDWITEQQWKAVPSVKWWEDVRTGKESIAKQKPMPVEEVKAMFERARKDKNQ